MILCRRCVDAIRTRGERIMTRPLDREDLESLEPVSTDGWDELYRCEWCEEAYIESEIAYAE